MKLSGLFAIRLINIARKLWALANVNCSLTLRALMENFLLCCNFHLLWLTMQTTAIWISWITARSCERTLHWLFYFHLSELWVNVDTSLIACFQRKESHEERWRTEEKFDSFMSIHSKVYSQQKSAWVTFASVLLFDVGVNENKFSFSTEIRITVY